MDRQKVTLRLDPDLVDHVNKRVAQKQMSRNAWINAVIRNALLHSDITFGKSIEWVRP